MRLTSRSVFIAALLLALASPGAAQDLNFGVSFLVGVGGSPDAEDSSFSNTAYQIGFSTATDRRTQFGVRLGQLDFDAAENLDGVFDAGLTYLTAGGEYRAGESFWESGVVAGLGAYNLDGTRFGGGGVDETSLGAFVGVLGDFEITHRVSVLAEVTGHYVDFDSVSTFLLAQAGITYRF